MTADSGTCIDMHQSIHLNTEKFRLVRMGIHGMS